MPELVQGIVLDTFKFKETSVVCKVFTLQHGCISVIIHGVGKQKSEFNLIHLQPLSEIEFVVYLNEKKGISKVKELHLLATTFGLEPNMSRYSISIFISEIVLRTFKEWETEPDLYDLLHYVSQIIGASNQTIHDVHLFFISKYTEILGFSIKSDIENDPLLGLDQNSKNSLFALVQLVDYQPFCVNKNSRSCLIKFFMNYLERHIEMPKIKSLQILEEVLS